MRKNITRSPSGKNHLSAGFTLIEVSIFIVILSLMAASAIHLAMIKYDEAIIAQNTQRMSAIQTALIAYVGKHQALPCPAALNLPSTNANYGTAQVIDPVTQPYCTGGFNPPGTFLRHYGGPNYVLVGAVPVHDLGLPDEYIADAWGRLFVYGVSEALTKTPTTMPPLLDITQAAVHIDNWISSSPCTGNPSKTCYARAGAPANSTNNLYVLLSNGKDGACGYTSDGTALPTPAAGDDVSNCASAAGSPAFNISLYNAPENGTHFDDIVDYATDVNVGTFKTCPSAPASMHYPAGYPAYGLTSADGQTLNCAQFPALPAPPPICASGEWLQYSGLTGWECTYVQPTVTVQPSCGSGDVLNSFTNASGIHVTCVLLAKKTFPNLPNLCNGPAMAVNTSGGLPHCGQIVTISQQVGCQVAPIGTPAGAPAGHWVGCTAKCDGSMSDSNGHPVVGAQVASGTIQGAETYSSAAESGFTVGAVNGYTCQINTTSCSSGVMPTCGMWCTATCLSFQIH